MNVGLMIGIIFIVAIAVFAAIANRVRMYTIDTEADISWIGSYSYAHRGLHDESTPENSLSAFENAIKFGYAIELDVQLTQDREVVVFHDSDLCRMTGFRTKLKYCTYSRIRDLKLSNSKEGIPTLVEALKLINGRVPVIIELKGLGISGRLERRVLKILEAYNGKYALQSFSPCSLRWIMRKAPQIPRGQLSCDFANLLCGLPAIKKFWLTRVMSMIKRLETNIICRPNFISYEHSDIKSKLLMSLKAKGAKIIAWTIDTEEDLTKAAPFADAMIFEHVRPQPVSGATYR